MKNEFKTNMAMLYGVNAAIIAQYLWVKTGEGKSSSCIYKGGRFWFRCPQQMITGVFPYLTRGMVKHGLSRLLAGGILRKGVYNESPFDHTAWYAFTEYGVYLMRQPEKRG